MSPTTSELRELLERRFPGTSASVMPSYAPLSSGVAAVDELVSGGLRPGTLSLFSGGLSSGKTGLALAFVAHLCRDRDSAAWLHGGSFSAPSAAHGGVALEALLQVRAQGRPQAQRCLDILLRRRAFDLVVVDWDWPAAQSSFWQRLRTLLHGSETALLVLSAPLPEASPLRFMAALHLHVIRRWQDSSPGGLVEVFLEKSRFSAPGGNVQLPYGNASGPFAIAAELPGLGQQWHEESG